MTYNAFITIKPLNTKINFIHYGWQVIIKIIFTNYINMQQVPNIKFFFFHNICFLKLSLHHHNKRDHNTIPTIIYNHLHL